MLKRKKKQEVVYHWHPNFRIATALPDIKTVRTDFLINSIAVTCALFAFAWLAVTFVDKWAVDRSINEAQKQIEENARQNKQFLDQSKLFVRDSKRLQELAKFNAQAISPLQLVASFADNRPEKILLDSVTIQSIILEPAPGKKIPTQQITLTGTLSGDENDYILLDNFLLKVLTTPPLKERIADPAKDGKIGQFKREALGVYKFTVTISLKPVL